MSWLILIGHITTLFNGVEWFRSVSVPLPSWRALGLWLQYRQEKPFKC